MRRYQNRVLFFYCSQYIYIFHFVLFTWNLKNDQIFVTHKLKGEEIEVSDVESSEEEDDDERKKAEQEESLEFRIWKALNDVSIRFSFHTMNNILPIFYIIFYFSCQNK